MTGLYLQGEGEDTFSEGVSSVTNVPTVRLEATVGSMNITKAIWLHGCGGRRAQRQPLFYKKNLKRRSRDCESLRMMLSVLGRVPAPVVGVNDAF